MTSSQHSDHRVHGLPRAIFVGISFVLGACGSDSPADITTRTTALCAGIVGMEAIAWEYYNGVPVVDAVIPPPFPSPSGGSFSHSQFPLLGFQYPVGWMPFELSGGQTVGADLIRNDNRAVWRQVSFTVNGQPDVRAVRDGQIDALLQFLGTPNAQVQVVCLNEGTAQLGGGITTIFSNVLIRAGTQSAIVTIGVTPLPGLPNSSVSVRLNSAPTAEYPDRLLDSFMAIDWQMLVGEITNIDTDGDGWLDQFDRFPNDPTRR
jgi:hypothetical protein